MTQMLAVRAPPFVETKATLLPSGDTAAASSIEVSFVRRSSPVPSGRTRQMSAWPLPAASRSEVKTIHLPSGEKLAS